MKAKLLIIILSLLLFINWQCGFTIGGGKDYESRRLWAPFMPQTCHDWCGIACIQMWADKDGNYVTQNQIASHIGIPDCRKTPPEKLLVGVSYFTRYPGWLEVKPWYEVRSKGDLIASTISGIKDGCPSIVPFQNGTHAVLMIGYKWREVNGRPIAISCWYNDPSAGQNLSLTSDELNYEFDCTPSNHWVIVGLRDYIFEGVDGHTAFIDAGGSYYGEPGLDDPDDFVSQQ